MKMLSRGLRIAVTAVVCLIGTAGIASSIVPHDDAGHQSSLRATVTMADGTGRTVTLQGVGCAISLCSRVRAKDIDASTVWLDGLASVREISHDADGPVRAILTFRNGVERHASIIAGNRVLYVQHRFGRTEKLDLASLTRIDFE